MSVSATALTMQPLSSQPCTLAPTPPQQDTLKFGEISSSPICQAVVFTGEVVDNTTSLPVGSGGLGYNALLPT